MDSDIKQLRPQHVPTANSHGRARGPEHSSPNGVHHRAAEPSAHGKPSADGRPSAPATDTVTVTGEAARLQELEQTLTSTPVVDSARVAGLRQAIASGNYQPNAESIADKLTQLEQDLL